MTRARGIALIAALLISVVLLLIGIGFLGQRASQYEAAHERLYQAQAGALAQAGLADALGKLALDIDFPPLQSDVQEAFTYGDEMRDSSGALVGTFLVTVNRKYDGQPYQVIQITSRGSLGDPKQPRATASRTAEIDVAESLRGSDPAQPNPDLFRIYYTTSNED
jgi:hypothetical protein